MGNCSDMLSARSVSEVMTALWKCGYDDMWIIKPSVRGLACPSHRAICHSSHMRRDDANTEQNRALLAHTLLLRLHCLLRISS